MEPRDKFHTPPPIQTYFRPPIGGSSTSASDLNRFSSSPQFFPTQSSPHHLKKVIPPPPGFAPRNIQLSPFNLDSVSSNDQSFKAIQKLQDRISQQGAQIRFLTNQLSKHSALPVSQLQSPKKYSMNDLISLMGQQNKCTKCEQTIEAANTKINLLKDQKNRVLTSFHELYKSHQKVLQENNEIKDVIGFSVPVQSKKAIEELSLKNKQITELREYIRNYTLQHTNLVNQISADKQTLLDQQKKVISQTKHQIQEKNKIIQNLNKIIEERASNYTMIQRSSDCISCQNKQKFINQQKAQINQLQEYIRTFNTSLNTSLKVSEKSVYPPFKYVIALNEIAKQLQVRSETDLSLQGLVQDFMVALAGIINDKPQQLASARKIRTQIHQHLVQLETTLEQQENPSEEMEKIKQAVLELPQLLKPLFELTKNYQRECPVLYSEAADISSDELYKFLYKVSEQLEGELTVEDIQDALTNYQELLSENKSLKETLKEFEQSKS